MTAASMPLRSPSGSASAMPAACAARSARAVHVRYMQHARMCTTCALHVHVLMHCMCTACALHVHVHCMHECTACACVQVPSCATASASSMVRPCSMPERTTELVELRAPRKRRSRACVRVRVRVRVGVRARIRVGVRVRAGGRHARVKQPLASAAGGVLLGLRRPEAPLGLGCLWLFRVVC